MRVVAIGASLGGLKVLSTILGNLPRTFPAAVAIVQHRRADAESVLCKVLARSSKMPVVEPCHGNAISAGTVYLAPAGYHLLVERGTLALSVDEEVERARPSADVLLESTSEAYRDRAVGVVLTGANADGAAGGEAIARRRGILIVQDPDTAEAPTCPLAALARTPRALVLRPAEIAPKLQQICGDD